MGAAKTMLDRAAWIGGAPYSYGPDDAGYYDDHRNHVLHASFDLSAEEAAGDIKLAIAVLGLAKVLVNGKPLGNVELLGHWTNFAKAVYFDTFELAGLVGEGENTVSIELGNGFYNPAPITLFGKYNLRERLAEVGTPHAAAAIYVKGAEGPICATDENWTVRDGALTFDNVYLGERCDLRVAAAAELGAPAHVYPGNRNLVASPLGPCRRFDSVEAVSMTDTPEGLLIDFGVITAGTIDLAYKAGEGQTVDIVYAEALRNGKVYVNSNVAGLVGMETPRGVCPGGPGAPVPALQRDVLTSRAGRNVYSSTFTYHSFRYALVHGLTAADVEYARAVSVHTDVADAGTFEVDNADYQALFDAARRTKLNNIHDVYEDCSRERFGYGGDIVSLTNSNLMVLNEEGLIDKTLADFARDQTERGGLPETAPFMGIGSNGPAYGEGPLLWQLAYPYLAVQVDRYYGRRDLIEREWSGLCRFGDYLLAADSEELAAHCLGDHGSILTAENFKNGTPDKELLGWCAQLWALRMIAEAGERVGRGSVSARYRDGADALAQEIGARFEHEDGLFGDRTQTSCAFAGMLGLGDPQVQAEALIRDAEARGGVFTTGIFGTMLAFDLLNRTGRNDVVERWLLRRDHPSLLSMLASGNGTLAEQFTEFLSSFDHAMFSSCAQWLMQALGGIRVADDAVACDKIVVSPYWKGRATKACCAYDTPHGAVRVFWERKGNDARVHVELPEGVSADLSALEGDPSVSLEVCER